MRRRNVRAKAALVGALATGLVLGFGSLSTVPASADAPGPEIRTANGTASMLVPETWQVTDQSGPQVNSEGRYQWQNDLTLTSDSGVTVSYRDGLGEGSGGADRSGVVDRVKTEQGFYATSWWENNGGTFTPNIAVSEKKRCPESQFWLDEVNRIHFFEVTGLEGETFKSKRAVKRFLSAPEFKEVLEVMASVTLYPVDQYAWPEGYEPPADPETPGSEFTTQNGSATFTVPSGFSVEDYSEGDPDSENFLNRVVLSSEDGLGDFGDLGPDDSVENYAFSDYTVVDARPVDGDVWAYSLLSEGVACTGAATKDDSVNDDWDDPGCGSVWTARVGLVTIVQYDETTGEPLEFQFGAQNGDAFSVYGFSSYGQYMSVDEGTAFLQGEQGQEWLDSVAGIRFNS